MSTWRETARALLPVDLSSPAPRICERSSIPCNLSADRYVGRRSLAVCAARDDTRQLVQSFLNLRRQRPLDHPAAFVENLDPDASLDLLRTCWPPPRLQEVVRC